MADSLDILKLVDNTWQSTYRITKLAKEKAILRRREGVLPRLIRLEKDGFITSRETQMNLGVKKEWRLKKC